VPTHYEVLRVARGASAVQVRRAYLEAARRHHPDMHAGSEADVITEARRAMAAVNAAWEVLGNPAARRAYDRSLGVGPRSYTRHGPPTEPEPEDEPAWTDEPAWAAEPDVDDTMPGLRTQSVVLFPVGLLAGAGAAFAFAMMSQIAAFLALSVVLLSLAAVAFVAAPLLTIRRRRPASPEPPRPRSEEQ
jgi:curved DNA-binding protein CbpA